MSPLSGILDNMCACSNYSEAQVRDEVSELRYRDDYFQMEQNSIVDDEEDEDDVTGRCYQRERTQRRQDRASKSAERSVRSLYGEEKQGFLFRDKLDFDFYHPQRPIRNVPSTTTDTTASMSSSSTESSSISSASSFSLTKLQKGRTLTTEENVPYNGSRSAQKTPCSSTYETHSLSTAFPSFSSSATVHRDNRTRDIKRKWQSRPIQVDPIILSV